MSRRLIGFSTAAAIMALALVAPAAQASLIFTLTTNNGGFGNPPGPYGTVTVDLISATKATITIVGNQVGSNVYLFGDGGTLGFNTNGCHDPVDRRVEQPHRFGLWSVHPWSVYRRWRGERGRFRLLQRDDQQL